MKIVIIQTTCKNKKDAKNIATKLIKDKLAACVQISKIKSVYSWNDKIKCEKEFILNIKTKKELFEIVKNRILKLHSYSLPEIIEIDISDASIDYIEYICNNTREEK